MSRRKQSNPKPLKRKAEDEELEELGEQLGLPRDVLCLGEPNSESEESSTLGQLGLADLSVQSVQKLKEGEQFGPYHARILDQDNTDSEDNQEFLQTKDQNGRKVKISLLEGGSKWLKLVKSSSTYHAANFYIYTHGDLIWCRIKRDLEPETELRSVYDGQRKFSPSPNDHRQGAKKIRRTSSEEIPPNLGVNGDSQLHSPAPEKERTEERTPSPSGSQLSYRRHIRNSPSPAPNTKILVNGDDDNNGVKRERVSPEPPTPPATTIFQNAPEFIKVPVNEEANYPDHSSGPTSISNSTLPAFPPYGFQPANVPPGGFVYVPFLSGQQMSPRPSSVSSVSSDQTEPKPVIKAGYNCVPCGITFSSLRTLQAHQSYYCAHRTVNLKNRNEDGTSANEDGGSGGRPKSRNHYSPRMRRSNVSNQPDERSRGGGGGASSVPAMTSEDLATSDISNASEATNQTANSNTNKSFKGKTYACNYCDYVTDRKGGLTRHVKTHAEAPGSVASSPPSSPPKDNSAPSTSNASERYCANCDIQFASLKTYHVHKAMYCGTRHVHKSTTPVPPAVSPPILPGTSNQQQPNIYEERMVPHSSTSRIRPSTESKVLPSLPSLALPGGAVPIVLPRSLSPNSTLPTSGIDPKTGLVFGQTFYAAISTSPLILVPCSYLPGRGITPSAGGIVLPNGSASDDALSLSPVPAFAVLPNHNNNNNTTRGEISNTPSMATTPKVRPLTPKSETDVKVGENSGTVIDKPLDLSLKKTTTQHEDEETEHVSPPKVAVVLPNVPIPLSLPVVGQTMIASSLEPAQSAASVLVKQGTSRCKECNIVFYRHENYLVHKRMYCASRQNRDNKRSSTSSPENGGTVSPKNNAKGNTIPSNNRREASNSRISPARSTESSPGHSPKASSASVLVKSPSPGAITSPQIPTNSAGVIAQHAIYQFYCLACGIKFTSLDNLRAHQTYYCPKRQLLGVPQPSTSPGSHSPRAGALLQDTGLRCSKCKHCFPSEETLRCHPCGSQRKCPYCEVYCPTLSAAQRHLVSHTGVKAFRCTICGYKGHTLRGMRTHIRIHLESGCNTPEENYIVCVGEDGVAVGKNRRLSNTSIQNQENNPDRSNSTTPTPNPEETNPIITQDTSQQEVQHWCQFCGYTSSYKGNVVRHIKLVHRDVSVANINNCGVVAGVPGMAPSGVVFEKIPPAPTLDRVNITSAVSLVVKKETSRVSSNGTDSEHSNDSKTSNEKVIPEVVAGGQESNHSSPGMTRDAPPRTDEDTIKKEDASSRSSSTSSNGYARPGSPPGVDPNPENVGGVSGKRNGSKYCKICDISFKHLSNFIAHKKFYCSTSISEGALTTGPLPQDNPNSSTPLTMN